MTEKQSYKPSPSNLLEMIKQRRYKDFKPYIEDIENQVQEAQQAVSRTLKSILVDKKYKEPVVLMGGMLLYKRLLLSGIMDFICNEIFPQEVHMEVAIICQFKGGEKDFTARGNAYFKEVMGKEVPKNTDLDRTSFIVLALEILKSMARWYPTQYDSDEKSIFRDYYERLLKKGVCFPEEKDFKLMTKNDEEMFKKNYRTFIDELNDAQNPQKSQEVKQPIKETVKIPELNAGLKKSPQIKPDDKPIVNVKAELKPPNPKQDKLKKELQRVRLAAQSAKGSPKQQPKLTNLQSDAAQQRSKAIQPSSSSDKKTSQIEMIKIDKSLIESKDESPKGTIQDDFNKMVLDMEVSKITSKKKVQTHLKSDSSADQNFKKLNMGDIMHSNMMIGKKQSNANNQPVGNKATESSVPGNEKKELAKQVGSFKDDENRKAASAKQSPVIVKEVKKEEVKRDSHHHPKKEPTNREEPLIKIVEPPIPVEVKRSSRQRQSYKQQRPKSREPEAAIMPSPAKEPQGFQYTTAIKQLEIVQEPQRMPINNFSFNDKASADRPQTYSQKRVQTPKKWPRVQRPNTPKSFQTSPQLKKQLDQHFYQDSQPSATLQKRRSLPKTEKISKYIDLSTKYRPILKTQQLLVESPFDSYPIKRQQRPDVFNKTLSYFANSRRKPAGIRDLQKYHSAGEMLDRMRLDRHEIAFHPRYFQPVNFSMNSLRGESLNLYGSGCSYSPFYFGRSFQARLIKQGGGQFLLSLHNISSSTLTIQPYDMLNIKHSKRIKIITWANNEQLSPCVLQKGGYLDIRFNFQVYDLNFKFLSFSLVINRVLEHLVLPVTLLDVCRIVASDMRHMQQYALRGSIITSQPIKLREKGLPQFLGGCQLNEITTKREQSSLIGQSRVQMDKMDRNDLSCTDLHVIIRLIEPASRLIQVQILFLTKDQQALDLSKVLLYNLLFLLSS